jgi:preprotein translocase subunit SecB
MEPRYDAFIRQVNLLDIHLLSVEYEKVANPDPENYSQVEMNYKPKKAAYCQKADCFEVTQDVYFSVTECKDDNECARKIFTLKAKFVLVYESKSPMDDELFNLFKVRNVPVNVHPYTRELLQNAMARVGLPPFTLPVLRIKR